MPPFVFNPDIDYNLPPETGIPAPGTALYNETVISAFFEGNVELFGDLLRQVPGFDAGLLASLLAAVEVIRGKKLVSLSIPASIIMGCRLLL
jgi:hypothetical protein